MTAIQGIYQGLEYSECRKLIFYGSSANRVGDFCPFNALLMLEVIHSPGVPSFNQQGRSGAVDNCFLPIPAPLNNLRWRQEMPIPTGLVAQGFREGRFLPVLCPNGGRKR